MSHVNEPQNLLADFGGVAPIFPLPELAFFPHVLLPLHIFEPRYREMTTDALAGDRLIGMATLKPDWETCEDPSRPCIYDHLCLGRVTAEERLPDGRFYLILQGLSRARVVEEVDSEKPYRLGRLELLPDHAVESAIEDDRAERVEMLLTQFEALFPKVDIGRVSKLRGEDPRILGIVCDVLAAAGRLAGNVSQKMLATPDVDARAGILLDHFGRLIRKRSGKPAKAATTAKFPPDFSLN
ncbi:MAG: LON peptidase substrate-binding domain-containing protein [Planctomycetota bacterium]